MHRSNGADTDDWPRLNRPTIQDPLLSWPIQRSVSREPVSQLKIQALSPMVSTVSEMQIGEPAMVNSPTVVRRWSSLAYEEAIRKSASRPISPGPLTSAQPVSPVNGLLHWVQ